MDSPRKQGDAALNLAEVMYLAIEHCQRTGATA